MPGPSPLREPSAVHGFLLGTGAGLLGLLPWLLAGWHPPWADGPDAPGDLIDTFLPVGPVFLPALLGIVVLPGAVVGAVLRRRTPGGAGRVQAAATAGRILVLTIAAGQTLVVLAPRIRPGSPVLLDVATSAIAVVLLLVVSAVVGRVLAHGTVPAATVAAAGGAVAAAHWLSLLSSLAITWMPEASPDLLRAALGAVSFLPAVLLGVTLAWCGWTPRRRLRAWGYALLIFWVTDAALGAAQPWLFASSRPDMAGMSQGSVIEKVALGLVAGLPHAATAILVGVAGRLLAPRVRRLYRERAGAAPTA